MMRSNTASALQKTYDECYLVCSTAVYYESQVCLLGTCKGCQTKQSLPMLLLCAGDYLLTDISREMKPKLYDHGDRPLTKYTTTMLTEYLPTTNPSPRPRKRLKIA